MLITGILKVSFFSVVMQKALYPDDDSCSDSPGLSGREKREYLQEIERIRSELAGFQPIAKPQIKDDQASIESDCEELGTADEFFWWCLQTFQILFRIFSSQLYSSLDMDGITEEIRFSLEAHFFETFRIPLVFYVNGKIS